MIKDIVRPMDIVLTGDRGLWPMITRIVTNGWKSRHDVMIPTHVAIALDGELLEMAIPKGEPFWDAKAILSPFSKYEGKGFFKPRAISIKRFPEYNDSVIRQCAMDFAYQNVGKLYYDFLGLLEFIHEKIDDDPERYICSELVWYLTRHDVDWPVRLLTKISPYDIWKCDNSYEIWRCKK